MHKYDVKELLAQISDNEKAKIKQRMGKINTDNARNYIRFSDFSMLTYSYAYVDVADYLADDILAQNKARVMYDIEMSHPSHCYKIVMCRVWKWQDARFRKSMDELKNKMLLCGHGDYLVFCYKLEEDMQKGIRELN